MPQLRPYQKEDMLRACACKCFGLFNEQRTGKTPTAVMTVHTLKCRRVLIVCPRSAMPSWADEYTTWTNGRPAVIVDGTPKKCNKIISEWDKGALVISYDNMRSTAKKQGYVAAILAKEPHAVIVDEAHRFKNTKSKTYASVMQLLSIPVRLCLTGTPASGKPEEIFALLQFIRPEIYTSYWKFLDRFFVKTKHRVQNRTFIEVDGFRPGKAKELQLEISAFTSQRKRKEVMQWLPAKEYENVRLPLNKEQARELHELQEYFETGDVVTQGTLDRLTRYRQICLAPELLHLPGRSPKIDWMLDYVADYPDTPTIVFSNFTSFLYLLKARLDEHTSCRIICGDTPLLERAKIVQDFQQGICTMLLINITAGKEALTLDRGECIIFTDQYPPVSAIQQAEDRFVATTEDRADKAHKIIRLMMRDSYDERIYALLLQLASATDLLNDYKKYLGR